MKRIKHYCTGSKRSKKAIGDHKHLSMSRYNSLVNGTEPWCDCDIFRSWEKPRSWKHWRRHQWIQ